MSKKKGKKTNTPRKDTMGKNGISLIRQNTKMRDSDQVGYQSALLWTIMLYYKLHLKQLTSDMLGLRSAFVSELRNSTVFYNFVSMAKCF